MSSNQVNIAIPYSHLPSSSSKQQPSFVETDNAFVVSKRSDGTNGVATINAYLHTALLVALLIVAIIFVSSSVGNGIGRSSNGQLENAITSAPARALQTTTTETIIAVITGITGDSTVAGEAGGIELDSVTYGVSHPTNVNAAGSGSGAVSFSSLTMVIKRGATYVPLFHDVVAGTALTISVSYYKLSGATQTRTALDTFTTAELTGITYNADGSVTLTAAYRAFTTNFYTANAPTGTTPATASWNLVTNSQNP